MKRPKIICMIPARLGSKRVKEKNLRRVGGRTLLGNAIWIARRVKAYDEVWVNTADERLIDEAEYCGAQVHRRPKELSLPNTNVEFKREFCEQHDDADYIVAQNPTSPLLKPGTAEAFCRVLVDGQYDTLHSVKREQAYFFDEDWLPVNFDFGEALDTQDLPSMFRVVWALTGWKRTTFLADKCGVWAGRLGLVELSELESVDIDTEHELVVAQCLMERQSAPA